ncbi:MAG: YIP1 family protein [Verrucomicrobia bacterium]|jgi:hypothetical protein|nr:YIP1 family protein [Verrucomicrobiota bacterium]
MDQPSPTPETQPDTPKPPATSLPTRLMNVFAAPGEVFEEVKAAPVSTANWLVPALLTIVVSWIAAGLIFSQESFVHQVSEIADKAIEKQIEKGHMPKAQADAARQVGQKWAGISTKISAVAGPVVAAFFLPFWRGLIFWLFGAKLFRGNFTYMKAVEAAGLTNMIGVLDAIVKTLLILSLGNLFASPSLALLVKEFDPQNPVHSLFAVVNIMVLWALVVRSIALARLSSVSFAKAAGVVFGLWAAFTGLMIGFGFAMRAISGG